MPTGMPWKLTLLAIVLALKTLRKGLRPFLKSDRRIFRAIDPKAQPKLTMTKKLFPMLCLALSTLLGTAQKMPVSYDFGETYNDRYRYSNLMNIEADGNGGYLLVRAYFQGLVLRPKGYLIERYNSDLELIDEYNYKLRDQEFINGFFK